jgi:hypothetical protein
MGCKVITGYLMVAASSKDPVINRVEAFSDGVFAIAITLLALGLEVPQVQLTASPNLLFHALLAEWPRFAISVLSFILIGEVWVNHHRMFSYIHRSAHWLIWLNLGLLLSVVVWRCFLQCPLAVRLPQSPADRSQAGRPAHHPPLEPGAVKDRPQHALSLH